MKGSTWGLYWRFGGDFFITCETFWVVCLSGGCSKVTMGFLEEEEQMGCDGSFLVGGSLIPGVGGADRLHSTQQGSQAAGQVGED